MIIPLKRAIETEDSFNTSILEIAEQGTFSVGGTVKKSPGGF